jgi:di/tricarboxylate transporter
VKISHTASAAKVYFRSALHTGTQTVTPLAVKLHVLLVFAGNTCGFIITSSYPSYQVILVRP